MNFFQHQEAARRSTHLLVLLFALAVISIVLAVNGALAVIYFSFFTRAGTWAHYGLSALPHLFFETTTAVVLLMIVGGTVNELLNLRAGGEAVAQMVGARPIDPGTKLPEERKLLNVIEEMALASGIPVPRAYVLDNEDGINAFAAGLHTNDAIVTVTRGTLDRLNRDELQGVVGHEFSHILNGDMTLNLRLIGVLQGLLLLALFGRFLTSISGGRDRRDSFGAFFLATGLTMLAIGYIGVFFGRLIKASVSRQREFLADASSVQFTRNLDGIGGALRKIGGFGEDGGGAITHIQAESLSHMFMAPVSVSLTDGMLASHPPLAQRLLRIYGRPVEYLSSEVAPVQYAPAEPVLPPLQYPHPDALAATSLLSPVGAAVAGAGFPRPAQTTATPGATPAHIDALHASIGTLAAHHVEAGTSLQAQIDGLGLRPALSDALQAQLLIMAMLLDTDATVRSQQMAAAVERFGSDVPVNIEHYAATISQLPPGWRLPLLDLAAPALRTLTKPQRDGLVQLAHVLIQADGRVTLAEFLLYSVLKRRLFPVAVPTGPGRMLRLADATREATIVMSLIANARQPEDPGHAFAAAASLLPAAGPVLTHAQIALPQVSAAFDRLALLAPLEKPMLVKACIAIAFVDGHSHWRAASCLRTLCAALDCPLPPQVEVAEA